MMSGGGERPKVVYDDNGEPTCTAHGPMRAQWYTRRMANGAEMYDFDGYYCPQCRVRETTMRRREEAEWAQAKMVEVPHYSDVDRHIRQAQTLERYLRIFPQPSNDEASYTRWTGITKYVLSRTGRFGL